MSSSLIEIIVSSDKAVRDRSLDSVCGRASLDELSEQARSLDEFRRRSENLYHRVRSLFFLSAIYRYYLPERLPARNVGLIPFEANRHLLERRFGEAIDALLAEQRAHGSE